MVGPLTNNQIGYNTETDFKTTTQTVGTSKNVSNKHLHNRIEEILQK